MIQITSNSQSGNSIGKFLNKKRHRMDNQSNGRTDKKKNIIDILNRSLIPDQSQGHSSDILPRIIEFKLSHIIKGSETQEIKEEKETNQAYKEQNEIASLTKTQYIKNRIGKGLNNLGNTCFLNSALQGLLYTRAFVNFLIANKHRSTCALKSQVCFLCQFEILIEQVFQVNSTGSNQIGAITPKSIIQNLKLISKHLKVGRQEDSHEFLVKTLESLEISAKENIKKTANSFIADRRRSEGNIISRIFKGTYKSTVTCSQCKYSSITKDEFYNVSLDIMNAETLENCFSNFCKPDYLYGNNKYFCSRCNTKRDSSKRFGFVECNFFLFSP